MQSALRPLLDLLQKARTHMRARTAVLSLVALLLAILTGCSSGSDCGKIYPLGESERHNVTHSGGVVATLLKHGYQPIAWRSLTDGEPIVLRKCTPGTSAQQCLEYGAPTTFSPDVYLYNLGQQIDQYFLVFGPTKGDSPDNGLKCYSSEPLTPQRVETFAQVGTTFHDMNGVNYDTDIEAAVGGAHWGCRATVGR